MSVSNIATALRRTTPLVQKCFRNAKLHNSDVQNKQAEMVVLFTWLGAKEKYAHKYCNSWNSRGFDVLEINCSIRDLLFPRSGAEVTAQRIVDFLDKKDQPAVVHGLSVGGYLTQRVLMAQQDSNVKITHQIFDSFTNVQGLEEGVKSAAGPKYAAIATKGVKLYKKYWNNDSIEEAEDFILTSPMKAPILYIHSMADKVAPYRDLKHLIQSQKRVAPVEQFLIEETKHVPHVKLFKALGEDQYMGLISEFLAKYPNEESWHNNQEYNMVHNTVPVSH
ncbi:unnamed protein product [Meganyctiphanes norvegica]|uniref:Uncharacterized protein n=1 Tax=Meganyctiphanes norvegica TaxID=48144 RepID=A0AAV2Q2L9_MEGNR